MFQESKEFQAQRRLDILSKHISLGENSMESSIQRKFTSSSKHEKSDDDIVSLKIKIIRIKNERISQNDLIYYFLIL